MQSLHLACFISITSLIVRCLSSIVFRLCFLQLIFSIGISCIFSLLHILFTDTAMSRNNYITLIRSQIGRSIPFARHRNLARACVLAINDEDIRVFSRSKAAANSLQGRSCSIICSNRHTIRTA